jgi:hypothetical protein
MIAVEVVAAAEATRVEMVVVDTEVVEVETGRSTTRTTFADALRFEVKMVCVR